MVWRGFMKMMNLLADPSILTEPEISAEIMKVWADRSRVPEPSLGPTREDDGSPKILMSHKVINRFLFLSSCSFNKPFFLWSEEVSTYRDQTLSTSSESVKLLILR